MPGPQFVCQGPRFICQGPQFVCQGPNSSANSSTRGIIRLPPNRFVRQTDATCPRPRYETVIGIHSIGKSNRSALVSECQWEAKENLSNRLTINSTASQWFYYQIFDSIARSIRFQENRRARPGIKGANRPIGKRIIGIATYPVWRDSSAKLFENRTLYI